ncbi:hypothetical protein ACI65C_002145 [Semiaphis heraclei]
MTGRSRAVGQPNADGSSVRCDGYTGGAGGGWGRMELKRPNCCNLLNSVKGECDSVEFIPDERKVLSLIGQKKRAEEEGSGSLSWGYRMAWA